MNKSLILFLRIFYFFHRILVGIIRLPRTLLERRKIRRTMKTKAEWKDALTQKKKEEDRNDNEDRQ